MTTFKEYLTEGVDNSRYKTALRRMSKLNMQVI